MHKPFLLQVTFVLKFDPQFNLDSFEAMIIQKTKKQERISALIKISNNK